MIDQIIVNEAINWYSWIIPPVIVFCARVFYVPLGTSRIIFVSRGKRKFAPMLGFFEVLIWILVIGQLVQNLHRVTAFIAYTAGFAAGNFVGMWIEDRLAIGTNIRRIILPGSGDALAERIHIEGFSVN